MINANEIVGTHDILFITLDTLRYDVACDALRTGMTPNIERLVGCWERRHSPGNFTYAAHHAFFAGFLPTPAAPGRHARLFASEFYGSETTTAETCVFEQPDIVSGLAARGYHTICIGGVGFFNKQTSLGRVLPELFQESHWRDEFAVTDRHSTQHQFDQALDSIERAATGTRCFVFINVSALHQPNCIFAEGVAEDSPSTQAAALGYVDRCLPRLIEGLVRRGPLFGIICSDHGTAYGEDGYVGHRVGHEVVWDVPYAEFILPAAEGTA